MNAIRGAAGGQRHLLGYRSGGRRRRYPALSNPKFEKIQNLKKKE